MRHDRFGAVTKQAPSFPIGDGDQLDAAGNKLRGLPDRGVRIWKRSPNERFEFVNVRLDSR